MKKQLFFLNLVVMAAVPFVGAYAEDDMGSQTQQQQQRQQQRQQQQQQEEQEHPRFQQKSRQRYRQRLADNDDTSTDQTTNPTDKPDGAMQDMPSDDDTMNQNPDQSKLYADEVDEERHDREENGNGR